ncbi:nphp3 [Symbiodinium necroappetens]|uniref:Nphp3 protein n=1 Tax=Symbiodinium necroappetens TaxID=1628268 RepID=A0A812S7L4_9DINO|nr:nphp3 [Symbiodinium necroappetens]
MAAVKGLREKKDRVALLQQIDICDKDAEEAEAKQDHKGLLVANEKSLHFRRQVYGEGSHEVAGAMQRICKDYNKVALSLMQRNEFKAAEKLLARAEEAAADEVALSATWNNFACLYRRNKKLRSAVAYLERALAIEERSCSPLTAQSHLNLCATLSQLARHGEALDHAQKALIKIYEVFVPRVCDGAALEKGDLDEALALLCVAYHNKGVEHEHMLQMEMALEAYASGCQWAARLAGGCNQLSRTLHRAAQEVKAKIPLPAAGLAKFDWLLSRSPPRPGTATSDHLAALLTPKGLRPRSAPADGPGLFNSGTLHEKRKFSRAILCQNRLSAKECFERLAEHLLS